MLVFPTLISCYVTTQYNGCVWKGGRLKLEKAKEHYLVRFERERAEESELASRAELAIRAPSNDFDANEDMASSRKFKKVLNSETPQLRMYFPSLRKVNKGLIDMFCFSFVHVDVSGFTKRIVLCVYMVNSHLPSTSLHQNNWD